MHKNMLQTTLILFQHYYFKYFLKEKLQEVKFLFLGY